MSEKYKMPEMDQAYFLTLTVVDWIDVFTRKNYKLQIVDSLRYCQLHKGLELYSWCLMTNHLHLIAKAIGNQYLWEILRDFKKFTAKALVSLVSEPVESRRGWMLDRFRYKGKHLKRISEYKFWQDGNHPEVILTSDFFHQKLNYIHNNPVKEMVVERPEDYFFSSARNYAGMAALIDVIIETPKLMTVR
jgi:putative transposase